MSAEDPKPEVTKEDDDVPELVDVAEGEAGADAADGDAAGEGSAHKESRAEKKTKKALLKLGLKEYPGVKRVTIKRQKSVSFVLFV